MRLATYNVEWFANLFDKNDALLLDADESGRHGVTRSEQAHALAFVFTAIDADAVMIVEAPNTGRRQNTARALEGFAAQFDLRTSDCITGYTNDTHQEIALLYDPAVLSAAHRPGSSPDAPRFDRDFQIDLDIDATRDTVTFSKPPLELLVRTQTGVELRLIGAHLKSKAPHGARTRDAIMRTAIANRRKQLAQAIWLRARIDDLLADGDSVIVLGDLNDGPGLDEFEGLFGRSSVEIVMGEGLYDPHARETLLQPLSTGYSTSRFLIRGQNRFLNALLDYIMISHDLMSRRPAWRIWHPFDDAEIWADPDLSRALLTASDHFPVSLDIDI
ncbi:MAG: endonuclease/exonuclease/phosphatase family protein [Pseudomonadota bacterium]